MVQDMYLPWTTPTVKTLDKYRQVNHQHEHDVLRWTKTQPAFVKQQPTKRQYKYGHKIYMLKKTKLTKSIRDCHQKPDDAAPIIRKMVRSLDEHFIILDINEQNLLTHTELLNEEEVYDLPSGSTRSIYRRLALLSNRTKFDTEYRKAASRIIRAIRCGATFTSYLTNNDTGELTEDITSSKICKLLGCSRPICHAQRTAKKKDKVKQDVNDLQRQAAAEQRSMVMIILKTPWALPKQERRYLPGRPASRTVGSPANIRPDQILPNHYNMLDLRLHRHKIHRAAFTRNKDVRNIVASNSHYTTEIAFLTPSTPGLRTFPNPHTHIITSIKNGTTTAEVKQELQNIWKKITNTPHAEVLVQRVTDQNEPEKQRKGLKQASKEALHNYFRKVVSQTPDATNLEWEPPTPQDIATSLCDRSLSELIKMQDSGQLKAMSGTFAKKYHLTVIQTKHHTSPAPHTSNTQASVIPDTRFVYPTSASTPLIHIPSTNQHTPKIGVHEAWTQGTTTPQPPTYHNQPVSHLSNLRTIYPMTITSSPIEPWTTSYSRLMTPIGMEQMVRGREIEGGRGLGIEGRGLSKGGGNWEWCLLERLGNYGLGIGVGGGQCPLIITRTSGGRDYDRWSEVRSTSLSYGITQSLVVPLTRLGCETAKDVGLAKHCDRYRDAVVYAADGETDPNQSAVPCQWVEEDKEQFPLSQKFVGLVEYYLVQDLFLARQKGRGPRVLRGFSVCIESDDDLDSIDLRQELSMNAEGGFAGAGVARTKRRGVSRAYYSGSRRTRKAEKVITIKAQEPSRQIGFDGNVSGEINVKHFRCCCRVPECDCHLGRAGIGLDELVVQNVFGLGSQDHPAVDLYSQKPG